jgi:glucose-6-phosphate isomerase
MRHDLSRYGFVQNLYQDIPQVAPDLEKPLVIIGTGGSSLGFQALSCLYDDNNVFFIDHLSQKDSLKVINTIKHHSPIIISISKSGETIETIFQTHFFWQHLIGYDVTWIGITEDRSSTLFDFYQKHTFTFYPHPEDVGGRFSIFTVVSMIPFAIKGHDVSKFRQGALKIFDSYQNGLYIPSSFFKDAYDEGKRLLVVMTYGSSLNQWAQWFLQLFSESLGKCKDKGITPLHSKGPMDQHSQLQLYMDGPEDKMYWMIYVKEHGDFVWNTSPMQHVMQACYQGTKESLKPCRFLNIDTTDEGVMGQFFAKCFLDILHLAHQWDINPFDQPAIETLKKNISSFMS